MYRSSPWRTTQMVTGLRSVPSARWVASRSSSAFPIVSSSSLVHTVIAGVFRNGEGGSEVCHAFEVLGVPGSAHVDGGGGGFDFGEVAGGELDLDCADVLL